MKTLLNRSSLLTTLRVFHKDEGGMEAVQAVITTAVGAMVMAGVYYLWQSAKVGGSTGIKGALINTLATLFQFNFNS
jgi:hypothetical protein